MYDYAEDFRTVYNSAWEKHDNFKGMPSSQARAIMRKLKPIMDEELIWFAYYENEPVAFLSLAELNQIFKHLNGKLNGLGKLKFYTTNGGALVIWPLALHLVYLPNFKKKELNLPLSWLLSANLTNVKKITKSS